MTDSISISDFYLKIARRALNRLSIASVEGETGCPDVYFGNYLHFTLPNSKIDYYISFSKFYE